MAEYVYPISLPGPAIDTFRDGATDPWVGDAGEVGAARRRKRFTRALGRWEYTLILRKSQLDLLLSFYREDLDDGVEAFEWEHPADGTLHEVRFTKRPEVQQSGGVVWQVVIEIEEI